MTATTATRRTQVQRRASTIARLLDATIHALATVGCANTTTSRVCLDAGLSQGALFRHFATRTALLAAATEEVCRRHVARLAHSLQALRDADHEHPVRGLVLAIREQARSQEHAAWHEVMVAARCDDELHAQVAATLRGFEGVLITTVDKALSQQFAEVDGLARTRLATIMLSMMQLFDSEAVTAAVYRNLELEADRIEWLTEILERELA